MDDINNRLSKKGEPRSVVRHKNVVTNIYEDSKNETIKAESLQQSKDENKN